MTHDQTSNPPPAVTSDIRAARQRAAAASRAGKAARKARLRAEVARLKEKTNAQR